MGVLGFAGSGLTHAPAAVHRLSVNRIRTDVSECVVTVQDKLQVSLAAQQCLLYVNDVFL